LGALFSPPDIISQLIIAIPLCLFYELIIVVGLFLSNKNLLLKNNPYILSK
jgi:Sec-independent protein secretion pathway component TatC